LSPIKGRAALGFVAAMLVCASVARSQVPGICANVPLGFACNNNDYCASGYCDAGNGTSKTGLCMPNRNGQIGDICSHDNQCALGNCQGLAQNAAGAWVPGVCATLGALGAACSRNDKCSSGYCDAGNGTSKTNRCMPNHRGQVGDICSNDNQCAQENCLGLRQDRTGAWIPGVCANKSTLGAACSQNYQCGSGYCDTGNGTSKTNRCMPNHTGTVGDICSNDNQCVLQICQGLHKDAAGAWVPGMCANKGALGAACSQNDKCASGYCDAGNGTSKTNRCMPNRNGQVGDICSNDNQCTTQVCGGLHQAGGAWVPGICASKKMLGDACSQNSQCGSAYCDTGNGTSHTDLCMPNNNGTAGQICSHNNQCNSHNCVGLHSAGGRWIPGKCQ
jgi:hypothetical protein